MNTSNRIVAILKKWPADPERKTRDFGIYLREMLKNNFVSASSSPEDQKVISQKLDALERLCRNDYVNKYSNNYKVGASGLEIERLKTILTDAYIDKFNQWSWFKWKIKSN